MESEQLVWQIGIIALVAGILMGALAYRLLAPSKKQAEEAKAELEDAREELNKYKADVSQHFDRTAELVNDLAQNYVNVYQHLADGAQTLGASKSFKELYGQSQGKPAIGVDERPDAAGAIDKDIPPESLDEHANTPETPVDYDAGSSPQTVNEEVDSGDSKKNDAEPAVSKSTDEPAEAAQVSEDPEKTGKQ